MKLFAAKTIRQFKLHQWLLEHGLAAEAVAEYEFPEENAVKITDHKGDSMTLTWENGRVRVVYNVKWLTPWQEVDAAM